MMHTPARYGFLFSLALLAACSAGRKQEPPPAVRKIELVQAGPAPVSAVRSAAALAPQARDRFVSPASGPMQSAKITLSKAAILDRDFLVSLIAQSASQGIKYHSGAMSYLLPSRYRIAGGQLQLVTSTHGFAGSDRNHVERLVQRFRILSQDEQSVTVEARKASPIIATLIDDDKPALTERSSWIRSAGTSEDGRYLLIESSVEAVDGRIVHVLEGIFPRDLLVPSGAKALLADPEVNPAAVRFLMLSNQAEMWHQDAGGKKQRSAAAMRFHWPAEKTIDWYVVNNIPEELLPHARAGVEAWNRYSRKLFGRDLVRFRGVLPAGVKFGDPRYNVIEYHSDPEETTAWASGASDPETGFQSNVVINVPYGQLKGSRERWQDELVHGHSAAEDGTRVVEEPRPPNRLPGMSAEQFARIAFQNVLFHEVGHALGLAHNFKGSLSFDPASETSPETDSVMDYVDDELLLRLFPKGADPEGPLLEYDRQLIAVLYGGPELVSSADPVLPACSRPTPDGFSGIDPLCAKWDAGRDPTSSALQARKLLEDPAARFGKIRSLPASLARIEAKLEKLLEASTDPTTELLGILEKTMLFYAQFIGQQQQLTAPWFYHFKPGAMSADDEAASRRRAYEGLQLSLQPAELPAETRRALQGLRQSYLALWKKRGGPGGSEKELLEKLSDAEEDWKSTLGGNLEANAYRSMAYREKVALFTGKLGEEQHNLEEEFVATLSKALLTPGRQRQAAAKALHSYLNSQLSKGAVERAADSLREQARRAESTGAKQNWLLLLQLLLEGKK